jgi:lipoprotein-releasing system permease protein
VNKHLKIIEYALSSLLRRKYRNAAIISAYTITVAALVSVLFLTSSLRKEADFVLEGAPDLIVQRTIGGRHELIPAEYGDVISSIRGVREVTPRYWGYYYDALTEANYTLLGSGAGAADLQMLDGHLPGNDGECAVGAGVAALRGSSASGELILVNSDNMGVLFEVSGVFTAASALLTNDLVVLTDKAVVDFFGFPSGMATDLTVSVPNISEVQTVAAKIKRSFPDSRPITRSELKRTYDMVFNWRSGMMFTLFCGAIIAFCIMAWDKATGLSGDEKQEIGILKAIGWDVSDVLALKFWEGCILSTTAFISGTLLSYIHVFFFDAAVIGAVVRGWSVLFPNFTLTPNIDLLHIFSVGFFTVIPYIACTVIPAWKTAMTDPDAVMRG